MIKKRFISLLILIFYFGQILPNKKTDDAIKNIELSLKMAKIFGPDNLLDATKQDLLNNINIVEDQAFLVEKILIPGGNRAVQTFVSIRNKKYFNEYLRLLNDNIDVLKNISPVFETKLKFAITKQKSEEENKKS